MKELFHVGAFAGRKYGNRIDFLRIHFQQILKVGDIPIRLAVAVVANARLPDQNVRQGNGGYQRVPAGARRVVKLHRSGKVLGEMPLAGP